MTIFKLLDKPNKSLSNILLLISLFILVFVIPLVPKNLETLVIDITYSFLFFFGIYALDKVSKSLLITAIIAFITQWVSRIFNMNALVYLSDLTNIVFLQIIIIRLIIQIAQSKKVSSNTIFESINGYLFMGLFYTVWVAVLTKIQPGSFTGLDPITASLHDKLYFTYVTMTTLGYGDVTPSLPLAKSLAMLISVSGQLYVAVIIAMLVGKYASTRKD